MTNPYSSNLKTENNYAFQGQPSPPKSGMRILEPYYQRHIRDYLSELPQHCNALEIGGGSGLFAVACVNLGWYYCTIEKSGLQTDILKQGEITVINATVLPIPQLDETFDLVHADQVLEHMNTCDKAILFVFVHFFFFAQELLRAWQDCSDWKRSDGT